MALVQHVDHFILADTFPYRRQSFQNRSKLRSPQGWHWISIPITGCRDGAPIRDVDLKTDHRWPEKHWRSFLYNYRTTMYFEFFKDTFEPFFNQSWQRLGPCVCRSVEIVAELFGLGTSLTRASTLDGASGDLQGILDATGAERLAVFGEDETEAVSAEIEAFTYEHPTYRQNFDGFEPGLSAADLVFNYGREAQRLLADGLQQTSSETANDSSPPNAG
jgi:hypothetical protein